MIPSAFVPLDALPMNPSGKIHPRALPAPDSSTLTSEKAFGPPESSLERRIAALWAELLGAGRVGRNDDFFALGGHSLLATRMLFRLHRELADALEGGGDGRGVELPLAAVFERRTVAGLAAEIEALTARAEADPAAAPVPATPGGASAGPAGAISRRRRRATVRWTDDGEVLAVDEPPRGE
jgi:hypothetical protein